MILWRYTHFLCRSEGGEIELEVEGALWWSGLTPFTAPEQERPGLLGVDGAQYVCPDTIFIIRGKACWGVFEPNWIPSRSRVPAVYLSLISNLCVCVCFDFLFSYNDLLLFCFLTRSYIVEVSFPKHAHFLDPPNTRPWKFLTSSGAEDPITGLTKWD